MTNGTILLVEDNPDDELLTLRALKQNKIENPLVIKRDGEEALAWLRSTEALPVLVLLDLKLPKIDGMGVLRAIRGDEKLKLMAVVVLTSSTEERDIIQSYHLGANSYIRKPVDFAQFTDAVRQLGLYWLVLNQPPPRR